MDFNELRQIQKEEREHSLLTKVNSDFDEKIKEFLHPTEVDIRSARSMRVCAEEILNRRLHKIVNHTILKMNEKPSNMTKSEKDFHENLQKLLKNFVESRI